jgi:hypothetical protein
LVISKYTNWIKMSINKKMKWMIKLSTTKNNNYIFSYDEVTDITNQLKYKNKQVKSVWIPTVLFIKLDSSIPKSSYDKFESEMIDFIIKRKNITSYIKNLVFYTSWYYDEWYKFSKILFLENPQSGFSINTKIIDYLNNNIN